MALAACALVFNCFETAPDKLAGLSVNQLMGIVWAVALVWGFVLAVLIAWFGARR